MPYLVILLLLFCYIGIVSTFIQYSNIIHAKLTPLSILSKNVRPSVSSSKMHGYINKNEIKTNDNLNNISYQSVLIPMQCNNFSQFNKFLSILITSMTILATPSLAEDMSSSKLSFTSFLTQLDSGRFNRVVFQGINPKSLIAYTSAGEMFLVQDGFPAFDDPKSPR